MALDTIQSEVDHKWMRRALALAKEAATKGEVPVGAILVQNGKILSKAYNLRETLQTSLGHAELVALQRASKKIQQWRLLNTTLYVTLEPCIMCAGALVQARVQRVVYGATDPKGGGVESLYQICQDKRLNHKVEITKGILANECGQLLKTFFKNRRHQNSSTT